MKKIFLWCFVCTGSLLHAQTTPGKVTRCISGNCKDGPGEALISEVDQGSDQVWYKGNFKDGLADGDGVMASEGRYWAGHFKNGFRDGHFGVFGLKWDGDHPMPDSGTKVSFADYDSHYGFESIIIYPDGSLKNYSVPTRHRSNWDYDKKIKDKWINEQVELFIASRKGKFTAPAAPVEQPGKLAIRKANTARDQWIEAIQWDCLTDRTYYLQATPQTKYHAMPFGGHFTMQVVASDNTVAYEGELGNYWTPRTPGKYTFLIKFYQDKILGGNGSDYVSGVRIEWELWAKK